MELKFNSVEEVLEFASMIRRNTYGTGMVAPGNIDPAAFVDCLARVANNPGGKISAIKLYRAVFATGLKEAKDAVERAPVFQRTPPPAPVYDPGCGDPECGCGDRPY